jgi:hypothetical protein
MSSSVNTPGSFFTRIIAGLGVDGFVGVEGMGVDGQELAWNSDDEDCGSPELWICLSSIIVACLTELGCRPILLPIIKKTNTFE